MRKELIWSLPGLYREDMEVYGYHFGRGDKAACVVGALRGNEVQQMYVCSQLVKALTELEAKGAIVNNNEILVIPAVNYYSMNIGKRFWAADSSDINRMFPGRAGGETTERIADGVFARVREYSYGVQFTSFYMPGEFVPHVRMMETGRQSPSLANLFGPALCGDPHAPALRHHHPELQLAALGHQCVLRVYQRYGPDRPGQRPPGSGQRATLSDPHGYPALHQPQRLYRQRGSRERHDGRAGGPAGYLLPGLCAGPGGAQRGCAGQRGGSPGGGDGEPHFVPNGRHRVFRPLLASGDGGDGCI